MGIIRCQACGKPNPEFLETCQYCEARLTPMAGDADETLVSPASGTVRCQACGRSNPADRETCQYCEARLRPLLADVPPAAPTVPPAPPAPEASAADDPLARLRSTQTFDAASAEPEAEAADQPEPADWMNRLRGVGAASDSAAGEPEADPEWMFTEAAAQPPDDSPDWLRDEPPPPADSPRAATDDDLPDWLSNLRASATPPTPVEPAEAPAPAAPSASDDDELPDWLRSDTPAPAAHTPLSQRPVKKMTNWLDELPGTPPPSPAQPEPTSAPPAETPAEMAAPPAAEAAAPAGDEPAAAQPTDKTSVPPGPSRRKKMTDWLTPADSGLPSQIPSPPPAEPEAELPDWLKAMQPAEDVPDWLRDVASAPRSFNRPATPLDIPAPDALALPGPAATPEADLPDWLKTLRADQPNAPADLSAALADTAPAAGGPPELPAWLQGAAGVLPPEPPILPASMPADVTAPETTEPAPPAPQGALPETTLPVAALPPIPEPPTLPWLQPEADEGTQAEPGQYELPDWLRPSPEALAEADAELAAEPPVDTSAIHAAELARAEEELPDWLRNLPAPATDATATVAGAAEPERQPEADIPAWLRPPGPPSSPPEPPELHETLAPAEVPDWLETLQAQAASPTLPSGDQAADLPPLDDETLAWLTASRTDTAAPSPTDTLAASAWLEDLALEPAPEAPLLAEGLPAEAQAAADAEPVAEPTPAEEMPDWLKALRGVPTQEQEAAEAMPDWLRALRGLTPASANVTASVEEPPASTPTEGEAPAVPAGEAEDGALPAWLAAMRPTDLEHPADAEEDAYEENVGVLAGMRGVLRAEPTVAQPHKSTAPVQRLVVAKTHAAQAKVLADLLAEEEPVRPLATRPSRAGQLTRHLERWFVFLLLALAIIIPQFVLPDMFTAPSTISREAQSAFSAVNLAPANQPALVAFDYDPAQQGELSPGAVAIVTHLMSRGVPVVGVSTRPLGAAVAHGVLEQVAADLGARANASYSYGTQYLNLGYIPGGPVGLLQFAAAPRSVFQADFTGAGPGSALWTQPILRGVDGLADFGLVVLITAAPDDTRAWIEQSQGYAPGIPRLAVVSTGAEPMVQPYIEGEAPQLDGLVAGLVGAAQYEQQAGLPGLASRHWGALGGGLWAAVLLIAGGNAVYATAAVLRQRRKR